MEVEITEIPPLAPGERSLIDMHSLLNVVNVLSGELMLVGLHLADDPNLLARSLRLSQEITRGLTEPAKAFAFASRVADYEQEILEEIVAASAAHPVQAAQLDHRETVDNIRSVFSVLEVRAREVMAQLQAPGQWVSYTIDGLRNDFLAVFAAIEKNSKGRYRIIYNLARQQPNDYYVDFVVESSDRLSLSMPILFKDVVRDLIANARKYTAPGGTINIGLYETATELRFVVQDTGCGIPADEIRTVVGFGRRGSNVAQVRTMGGGFGLTKAFLVAKQFGGRMWIKSELGAGTRITVTLPRPLR
jgi:signal transduction histidine kinase